MKRALRILLTKEKGYIGEFHGPIKNQIIDT